MTRAVPARTFAAIIVLLGVVAAVVTGRQHQRSNELLLEDALQNAADRAATALTARLRLYEYGLRGVRAAIIGAGGETISRARFAAYIRSRDLPNEFPGAFGFGFVRRVAPDEAEGFVASVRQRGAPEFAIHALAEHTGERFVIELVEPLPQNASALGLDLGSEPRRRAAALRAMETGHAAITAPIELVQLPAHARTGFLLFLPLLRDEVQPSSAAEREANTLGWAYGVVSLQKVLATFDLGDEGLTMALSDISTEGAPTRMFGAPERSGDARLTVRRSLAMFGRKWQVELAAGPRFVARLRLGSALSESAAVLGVALLLAFASYLYLGRLEHARQVAERQQRELEERVVERTEEVRRANERLQVLAVQLQTAQRITNVGSWEFDVASAAVDWSDELFHVFGVDPAEGVPDAAGQAALFTEETWSRLSAATEQAICTGASYEVEATVIRRDGEHRIAVARAESLRGASGAVERVVGTLQDITARERAATQLRNSETMQRAMLAHAGSAIIACDPRGTITLFNRASEELLGYAASEVIHKTSTIIFHDMEEVEQRRLALEQERGAPVSVPDVFTLHCREGRTESGEWTCIRKDGSRVPVLLTLTAIRDDEGGLFGYLGVAFDLTAQKDHQRALQELNQLLAQRTEQAESASRAKSMFLANMSHEIRTPIGAITGLTYLLSRTQLEAEQRQLLDTIERSTKTLLGMVNDVLDLSKIEAQQLMLESSPFVLGELLRDVSAFMHAYATGKPLALHVDASDARPEELLLGDRIRLMQVLTNLIGNAIKYTDEGSVRLLVTQQHAGEGEPVQLRFEVQDTGAGIAPDFLPHLFSAFTQAEPRDQRRREGTGLGLAIVKQLVTMMGGRLGAESELGVGSRFWVSIPLARAAQVAQASRPASEPPQAATDQRLSGVTLLVADDSDINRDIARCILELEGAHVRLANDGAEAVEMVCAGAGEIDLVLMDVQMPVEDGVAATQRIRADPRFAKLPILAVTAGALATERDRALAAGMDDFVTKPYDPETLIAHVRARISAARGHPLDLGTPRRSAPPTVSWPPRSAANDNLSLDATSLARLQSLLREQDFDAFALVAQLRPTLERHLGAAGAACLHGALERLDFAAAEALVAQIEPKRA